MIGATCVKQVGGVDGHRAVEVDRNCGQTTGRLQFPKMVEQRLGPTDGEGGDQNGSTTRDRPLDDAAKRFGRVGRVMDAVAVGRFDDDVIRFRYGLWVGQHRIVEATKVAGENDTPSVPCDLGSRGAEDMTRMSERQYRAGRKLDRRLEGNGREGREAALGIPDAVEDRTSVVSGKSVSVRVALGGRRILKTQTNNTD